MAYAADAAVDRFGSATVVPDLPCVSARSQTGLRRRLRPTVPTGAVGGPAGDDRHGMRAKIERYGPGLRRHTLRACRLAAVGLGAIALLAGLCLVGALAWFMRGPVELAAAARSAETVLAATIGEGAKAKVDAARLSWSLSDGLAVELRDITVADGSGAVAAAIPQARITLNALPILVGSVKPSGFEIASPRLSIDLSRLVGDDNAPAPTAGQPAAAGASPPQTTPGSPPPAPSGTAGKRPLPDSIAILEGFAKAIHRGVEASRSEGLRSTTVTQGTIEITRTDALGRPRKVVVPEIEIAGLIDGPGGAFDMGFSARGEVGRWTMRLRELARADGTGRDFVFEGADVTHRDLFGPPVDQFDPRMPGNPTIRVGLGADDAVDRVRLETRFGAGLFRFGKDASDEVFIDAAQTALTWNRTDGAFSLDRITIDSGETHMALHGRVVPGAGTDDPWTVSIVADPGRIKARDVDGEPLAVEGGAIEGTWDPVRKVLDLPKGEIHYTGGAFGVTSRLDLTGPKPRFLANIAFSPLDVEQAKRWWPTFTAPEAREWFLKEMHQGRFVDAVMKLDIPFTDDPPHWPAKAIDVRARIEQGSAGSFGNLPPVTGAEGRVTLADKKLEVVIDRAQIATKAPKRPSVDMLRFTMPDVFQKPPRAAVKLQVSGDVAAIAEVLNAEPLAVLDEAGIKPETLSGAAAITANVDILFEDPIKPSSVTFRLDATVDKFSSTAPVGGRRIQDGKLKIVADQNGTAITGKASIDGVPADLNMYTARGSGQGDRRDLKIVLDDAARQRMGLDLADMMSGPVTLAISQPTDKTRHIEADLAQARLTLGQFGWSKGPGVPAKAVMDLVEDDKGTRIDNLSIESENFAVKGSAVVDKDKHLAQVDIARLQLRKGDDAKLKLVRAPDQSMNASFEAGTFDVRGLILSARQSSSASDNDPKTRSADLNIKARVAKLVGFNDVVLSDVAIDGQVKAGTIARLQVTGRVSGGRSVDIRIQPDGARRIMVLQTDDAGSVLSFLDVFDRIRGGSLAVQAAMPGVGSADGQIRLTDFRLLEQPKSGRGAGIERLADGTEQIYVRRAPIPPGTDFDRATAHFALRRGVVTVTDGIIKGQQTGATVNGQLDLNNQRAGLAGTYIPLYGLNNLVGRIPLIGEIAGAGRNEGLVGVTFRIVGPLDDPVLQINPISAIAPGIFRRIFEFRSDERRGPTPPAPVGEAGPTRILPN